jgi:molybdopterin/thiamine biosynthesis adenylyltransferase
MPNIRLSRSASVTPTGEGVILRSDLSTFQLTGADVVAFLERMLPLLDGSRDAEGLFAALPDYSRASVQAFLDLLQEHGLLEASDEATSPLERGRRRGQQAFLDKWSPTPGEASARLRRARVLVVGLEPWIAAAAAELAGAGLAAIHLVDGEVERRDGIARRGRGRRAPSRREATARLLRARAPWCQIEESPLAALDATAFASRGPWDLLLAAVRPDDLARTERVARFAHRHGQRSLWSWIEGGAAIVGPLVAPGETACPVCATVEELNPPRAPDRSPPEVSAHAAAQLLGHLVAMEALKTITAYTPPRLGGRLLVQELATLEASVHTLVRTPWCRVCGEPE